MMSHKRTGGPQIVWEVRDEGVDILAHCWGLKKSHCTLLFTPLDLGTGEVGDKTECLHDIRVRVRIPFC